ncbi:hypothetical protein GYMLUDRAFT_100553 [Collybiopsis luxurians FD-317 M1]|uniref:DUF6535 domain-containing protein n=1 Tax=Collybiopsis luxurians FD-317 M1 TaxID=944289 RepID=A0A0D0AR40_9AGAR|nr:hypothetical protein GYMLUDRAFT_100553 [Collybiopsis luxurians FD-317 M1]
MNPVGKDLRNNHVQFSSEDLKKSFRNPAFSEYAPSLKSGNEAPLSSRLWTARDQYRYSVSPKTGDHWEKVMRRIDLYDEDMCKGWREDVDTLLVFAGLFSAAVTAFLIESYAWLQQSPQDSTNLILLQVIQQLRNSSNPIPENLSRSAEFSVTPLAIRINVFWFSSLALSLSCAIIGILCKQWLREYQRDAALSPKDALMLRQTRLESFERWKVDDILSALPLLLQSALVLFFVGIVDLLWSLNTIVAIVLTCEIGVALFLVSMTTVFPSFALVMNAKLPCAYKSPQAWIFYRAFLSVTRFLQRNIRSIMSSISFPPATISPPEFISRIETESHLETISRIKNWTAGDRLAGRFSNNIADGSHLNDCLGAAMHWVYSEYRDNVSMTPYIFYCLEELDEETLAVATGQTNLKSRYDLYCDLVKNLPQSQERQKFACELLLRDANGETTSQAQRSLYILHLAYDLRFGQAIDTDEDFLLQIIHTIRNFVQCSFDGPSLSYQNILDVSYLFLFCWRDCSEDTRRYSLLALDDIERCIPRLSDPTAQATFAFDFIWLMSRAAETNNDDLGPHSWKFYDPLICSERFLQFVKFLDRYYYPANDMMDPSDPIVEAWKQQKVSLAIQGGLPPEYFDCKSPTGVKRT